MAADPSDQMTDYDALFLGERTIYEQDWLPAYARPNRRGQEHPRYPALTIHAITALGDITARSR